MLVKPKIINSAFDSKLCSFKVDNPFLGELQLNSRVDYNCGFKRMYLELVNVQKKLLGREELSVTDNYGRMLGLSIKVEPEYRNDTKQKNYRLGEILRLASIIEMIENKKNIFKIFSRNTAIFFHSKYKFEPDITNFEERNNTLETIAEDLSMGFEDLRKRASDYLAKAKMSQSKPEEQRRLCGLTNLLSLEYIRRIQKLGREEYKQHPFKYGIDMVLTRDKLIKNRAFFNELFRKHGIDYTI